MKPTQPVMRDDRQFKAHMDRMLDLARAVVTVTCCVALAWLLAEAFTPCVAGRLC